MNLSVKILISMLIALIIGTCANLFAAGVFKDSGLDMAEMTVSKDVGNVYQAWWDGKVIEVVIEDKLVGAVKTEYNFKEQKLIDGKMQTVTTTATRMEGGEIKPVTRYEAVAGEVSSSQSMVAFIYLYIVKGFFYALGAMFIKALKMLVVPLVFCSLIGGICGMDDMKTLGRTGGKAFAIFMCTTVIAIALALTVATTFGIGEGFTKEGIVSAEVTVKDAPGFADVLISIVPGNILGEMASGNMLAVIFIAVIFGVSISHSGKGGERTSKVIADLNDVIMALVNIVMNLAPYGVFCLMAKTFAEQGYELFIPIMGYFLTVAGVLIVHYIGTFSGIFMLARLNPLTFLKKMKNVITFAFSTASSNATIPVTMRAVEERMGVHNSIASFVVPLGATINMNGTAIMQGVATVFVANVYNIDLSMMDYLTVIGMSVLASIGTAGVPGVGLIMLAMVFAQVGLPIEGIALIMGVDRLLDMMRTAVNVTGDAATSVVVAKSEGKLDLKIFNDPNAGQFDPIDVNSHEHDSGHKA